MKIPLCDICLAGNTLTVAGRQRKFSNGLKIDFCTNHRDEAISMDMTKTISVTEKSYKMAVMLTKCPT